jgi:regulatory protein
VIDVLRRKGIPESQAAEAVETLRRLGALDDERFASASAAALARRGFGDRAILFRLGREGVAREVAAEALASLAPEFERARGLVERRGASPKTARWLAGRGFARESIEAAIADGEGQELG